MREQLIRGKLTREKKFCECRKEVQHKKTFFAAGNASSFGGELRDHFQEVATEN